MEKEDFLREVYLCRWLGVRWLAVFEHNVAVVCRRGLQLALWIGYYYMLNNKEKDIFFSNLAAGFGSFDTSYARKFYYNLARYIVKELKEKGKIELPDLGVFKLSVKKGVSTTNMWTGERVYVENIPVVKFNQGWRMKAFFKGMKSSKNK